MCTCTRACESKMLCHHQCCVHVLWRACFVHAYVYFVFMCVCVLARCVCVCVCERARMCLSVYVHACISRACKSKVLCHQHCCPPSCCFVCERQHNSHRGAQLYGRIVKLFHWAHPTAALLSENFVVNSIYFNTCRSGCRRSKLLTLKTDIKMLRMMPRQFTHLPSSSRHFPCGQPARIPARRQTLTRSLTHSKPPGALMFRLPLEKRVLATRAQEKDEAGDAQDEASPSAPMHFGKEWVVVCISTRRLGRRPLILKG